ncbi:alpha/beta hydrolase [Marinobacter sp. M216]|uniref:Alpha/beta hydrolase n=1 Tax=Marinobacter albus TaxID=3030833 RepID=A0ABT7H9K2_9GAMM|nr:MULTISPECIES: alpha/beta hydrolase [unclassified Marinobacter]MDK9557028.1 alpha/beta hydrolase [Marinobacter sp. M216]
MAKSPLHRPTPIKGDQSLQLCDGRRLAYTDLGDPAGYPLIFGHGMPGCRLEGRFLHERARRHRFRLLTPDRPGIGASDYQPGRTLLHYPEDIRQLADHLALDRFSHLGWSSGGSRTLACCYGLGHRVDLGVCLSGYTNFSEYPGAQNLIEATRWPGPRLARHSPGLTRLVVRLVAWLSRRHPGLYLREAEQLVSEEDRNLLRFFLKGESFRRDQLMCLASGGRAIATDLMTELEDWGFQLADIATPVLVYQGEQDPFIPVDYARHLADNLPHAELTLLPGAGHLYPLAEQFQDQLFLRIRQHLNHTTFATEA